MEEKGAKRAVREEALQKVSVPTSELLSIDAVDAALAAWTGLQILKGHYEALGTDQEGYLLIPSLP